MPSASQCSSTGSASRFARLNRFCTETIVATLRASSSSSTSTSDSPMWRILPSSWSFLSSPTWSSAGTAGSMRCSWKRSIRSTPRRRSDISALLAQVRRRADRGPLARSLSGQPRLGGDHHVVVVRVQRLAEQVLRHVRAVGVGGVEERHADLDRAPQHGERGVVVARRSPDALAGQLHGAVAEAYDGQVTAEVERAGRGGEVGCCRFSAGWGHSPDRSPDTWIFKVTAGG